MCIDKGLAQRLFVILSGMMDTHTGDMVAHTCNHRTQNAEAGANVGYTARSCLTKCYQRRKVISGITLYLQQRSDCKVAQMLWESLTAFGCIYDPFHDMNHIPDNATVAKNSRLGRSWS